MIDGVQHFMAGRAAIQDGGAKTASRPAAIRRQPTHGGCRGPHDAGNSRYVRRAPTRSGRRRRGHPPVPRAVSSRRGGRVRLTPAGCSQVTAYRTAEISTASLRDNAQDRGLHSRQTRFSYLQYTLANWNAACSYHKVKYMERAATGDQPLPSARTPWSSLLSAPFFFPPPPSGVSPL